MILRVIRIQLWKETAWSGLTRLVWLVLCLVGSVQMVAAQELASRLNPILASKGKTNDAVRLQQLFQAQWSYSMEQFPESATYNGYPGQNHRWTDLSLAAIERRKKELPLPLEALRTIDRARLSATDQLSFDLFERDLRLDLEGDQFPSELLPLNQLSGVQHDVAQTLGLMPAFTVTDFDNMVARLRGVPVLVEQTIALLEKGLKETITPPRITLRDVPQQIRNQIVEDLRANALYGPFTNLPAHIPAADRERLASEAAASIREGVLPAYRKLLAFVTDQYIPRARTSIALSTLPKGPAWYAFNARRSTTTALSPEEIHQVGLNEVKRIRAEMERVIAQTGFVGSFADFVRFLRTDPRFFYTSADDLIAGYREISKRADPELAKLFGKLPRLPYGVLPVPSYAEKSQTTAYYQPGAAAFGRPGYFFANTYDLKTRPKWEMEALTLHEAVPGHHLQIALAQELENVPEFRKHRDYTAFVEGWGLYSESLGEEMGFYKDPYAKFGQLTYEMWRAVRLVVDTGMHALGWTREQAISFFKENAAKTEHDIIVEIDRYIVWPGQALAYKIGELKIKELRRQAEAQLGDKFNIRAFHDELLGQGALPLDLLELRMKSWVARSRR